MDTFDCIIVGGGHAGIEATMAVANAGHSVVLITNNVDRLGHLSCNPAIGGVAKGHIVKEIDALGGVMGILADTAGIQFRTLNISKGPAVRSTRAQMDRERYSTAVKACIFSAPTITVWNDMVVEVLTDGAKNITGVRTQTGKEFYSKYVIITAGTFLEGKIFVGQASYSAGRLGDPATHGLSASLEALGLQLGRLKTGTPPRILRSSIDFSRIEEQAPEELPRPFSFTGTVLPQEQVPCHITWTNPTTHEVIRKGFSKSPMFSGLIQGKGARYCPSIEDKVFRFPEKQRHQIFIEPEGYDSYECYPNGISTSLPLEIQEEFIKTIVGLEDAVIVRHGYAIEYDYVNPIQIWATMETKAVRGLYLAGQINGTSGYEEAAGQGLLAGLNVIAKLKGREPVCIGRHEGYIGVLVDDLVTLGTEEPYRMFTSRAEYRLALRESNADARLTPLGRELGLIDDERWEQFQEKQKNIAEIVEFCKAFSISHAHKNEHIFIEMLGTSLPNKTVTLAELLRRPEISIHTIKQFFEREFIKEELEEAETIIKYDGYLQRQEERVQRSKKMENTKLPEHIEYAQIPSLTQEAIEKLSRARPRTLGNASRISGITPATISSLEIYLKKMENEGIVYQ